MFLLAHSWSPSVPPSPLVFCQRLWKWAVINISIVSPSYNPADMSSPSPLAWYTIRQWWSGHHWQSRLLIGGDDLFITIDLAYDIYGGDSHFVTAGGAYDLAVMKSSWPSLRLMIRRCWKAHHHRWCVWVDGDRYLDHHHWFNLLPIVCPGLAVIMHF